jgi:hypothetical protein
MKRRGTPGVIHQPIAFGASKPAPNSMPGGVDASAIAGVSQFDAKLKQMGFAPELGKPAAPAPFENENVAGPGDYPAGSGGPRTSGAKGVAEGLINEAAAHSTGKATKTDLGNCFDAADAATDAKTALIVAQRPNEGNTI